MNVVRLLVRACPVKNKFGMLTRYKSKRNRGEVKGVVCVCEGKERT
jgi:hypothetical protein